LLHKSISSIFSKNEISNLKEGKILVQFASEQITIDLTFPFLKKKCQHDFLLATNALE
jgi:hypothetical protein